MTMVKILCLTGLNKGGGGVRSSECEDQRSLVTLKTWRHREYCYIMWVVTPSCRNQRLLTQHSNATESRNVAKKDINSLNIRGRLLFGVSKFLVRTSFPPTPFVSLGTIPSIRFVFLAEQMLSQNLISHYFVTDLEFSVFPWFFFPFALKQHSTITIFWNIFITCKNPFNTKTEIRKQTVLFGKQTHAYVNPHRKRHPSGYFTPA